MNIRKDLQYVKRAEIVQTYMAITASCCRSSVNTAMRVAHVVVFIPMMDQNKLYSIRGNLTIATLRHIYVTSRLPIKRPENGFYNT